MSNSAERHWQNWGKANPYFGVLTDPKFLNRNLNQQSREEFFQSGERHVIHVNHVIQTRLRPDFQPRRILDFGCGVGRLLIPFAQRAQSVMGIDISPGMLEQAANNCRERAVNTVQLLPGEELDRLLPNSFDLVHSYIVFQHIPVAKGEFLLRKLINLIAIGGIGVIHLPFSDPRPALRRAVSALRARSNLLHGFINLAQGKSFSWPMVQMNCYSMNRVFDILTSSCCSNLFIEFEDHGEIQSAILYFEKKSAA
ncbi:MAG TPA: class I SAM-dependent methyltransferase [Terracidiphilus sp.]|nr:class I SAM-dependent methyltransferase [Terracidiphilus sp.]